MSSTRSASACVARLSAAAPKSVTVLICPVRPNARFSIIDAPFLSALVPEDALLAPLFLSRLQRRGSLVCRSQGLDGCKVFGVVAERRDVYHGPQYRPLSSREQALEDRRSAVCPFWLPSTALRGSGIRRHGYGCSASNGFTAFSI